MTPTGGVVITPATLEDCPAIQAIYAHYVLNTAISFETAVPDRAEIERRFQAIGALGLPYLVARNGDGTVLAYAYAGRYRERQAYENSVEVTVYSAPQSQRRGHGRALYEALLVELKRIGKHAAFAGITLPNNASVGLHEAVGFSPVGVFREVGFKFDRWHDVGWWQRLI